MDNEFQSANRTSKRVLYPGIGTPRMLDQRVIGTTSVYVSDPISLPNLSTLTVISIIKSSLNTNIVLGAVPYEIVFLQGSLDTTNMIPGTSTVSGYSLFGPCAMPTFSPNAVTGVVGGSDGDNLVYITSLYNNTGSTQTIYYISQTRVFTAGGVDTGIKFSQV